MKDWWAFIIVCGATMALLAFWAGAVSVTGVAPDTAPHGIIEYWSFRYQTVIASMGALAGAAFVVIQIRAARDQHKANVRLALRNELEAVDSAEMFAENMVKAAQDNSHDVSAALLGIPPPRQFIPIEADRLARIEQWSGDALSYFIRRLIAEIANYNAWCADGSKVTEDLWGGTTPSAMERIGKIRDIAINTAQVAQLRRQQLQSYWT